MGLSEAHKAAISRGQIERHRRNREQQDRSLVTTKICTRCGVWKQVPDDYVMRRRKLKSGEVTRYPSGECKECGRRRAKEWRDSIGQEELKRRNEKSSKKYRHSEKGKRTQREYGRMKRIEQGATPRGPWKRYANESGGKISADRTSAVPFRRWWNELPDSDKTTVRSNDSLARYIYSIVNGNQENVELSTVDAIGVSLGRPDLLSRLYPQH